MYTFVYCIYFVILTFIEIKKSQHKIYGGGVWFRSLFGTIADYHRNSTFGLGSTRVRFIFRSAISSEYSTQFFHSRITHSFSEILYKMKSNFKAKHFNFRGVKKEEMQRRNENQIQFMTVCLIDI